MGKTVGSYTTRHNLQKWIKLLMTPQRKLDGLPICPYLQKFRSQIMLVRNEDPEKIAKNFADQKNIFHLEGMVVYGFAMKYEKLDKLVDKLNKNLKAKDVCCFMFHPDGDEDVLPVEYPFNLPVLIVQKISTLTAAKKQLSKTNYYKHYK